MSGQSLNIYFRGSLFSMNTHCDSHNNSHIAATLAPSSPQKYALKMQLWLLRRRFETYLEALQHTMQEGGTGTSGVLLDRSVFSDYVFAVKNYQDGNISPEGFNYYLELRDKMLHCLPLPAVTLYLDVKAEICYDRIHRMRCRDCETGIQLDYLQGLDECYQSMLRQMSETGSHVMRIQWDEFGNVRTVANTLSSVMMEKDNDSSGANFMSQHDICAYVAELLHDEEKRRQVMYLDYTIEELEDDDIAAAIEQTSPNKIRTQVQAPLSPSCKQQQQQPSLVEHSTSEKHSSNPSTAVQINTK